MSPNRNVVSRLLGEWDNYSLQVPYWRVVLKALPGFQGH